MFTKSATKEELKTIASALKSIESAKTMAKEKIRHDHLRNLWSAGYTHAYARTTYTGWIIVKGERSI
jgi:hypothetical protein